MKFKNILAKAGVLALCLTMVLPSLTGCNLFKEIDASFTGPELNVSVADLPASFDPMYAYLDNSASQLFSFLYSGLFKYDKNGKPVKDLCSSYKWVKNDDETGEYIAEFTIKKSAWSDKMAISAEDFVFAWRRILDPSNFCDGASLLYDIKNASKVKSGEVLKFNLGATAVGTNIIRIEFEHKVDLDDFTAVLASPLLVPLRTDIADKIDLWASTPAIVVSNGPFYLKTYQNTSSSDMMIVLERNRYYFRNAEEDDMDKYVTPYRINIYLDKSISNGLDKNDPLYLDEDFENLYELNEYLYNLEDKYKEKLDFYGNVGAQYIDKYKDSFKKSTSFSTQTVVFNTENEVLSKPEVRKALSMVINRAELVKAVNPMGTPSVGFVPEGVFNTGYSRKGETFREAGEAVIKEGTVDEAKALLKSAGVSSGSFSISVRSWDVVAVATAEYLKDAWKQIGFTVKIEKINYRYNIADEVNGYDKLTEDTFTKKYLAGEFDVALVDVQQYANTPFSALAAYATTFSGASIDLKQQQDTYEVSHISGYASADYDKLIADAYAEADPAKKAELLHQAEALLAEAMPTAPLFTYGNIYTINSNIKGVEFDWYGNAIFTEADDKDWKYVPEV